MYDTNGKIITEYKQAKQKNKQITILAQLNACSREDIIAILEEGGIDVPYRYKYKGIPNLKPEKTDKEPLRESVETSRTAENRSVKSAKPQNTLKESDSEKGRLTEQVNEDTMIKEPLSANIILPTDPKPVDPISEATYHLVQIGLARIDRRITKIERKQKKLMRLYKQLANLILG